MDVAKKEVKAPKSEPFRVKDARFHESIFWPTKGGSHARLQTALMKDLTMWWLPGDSLVCMAGSDRLSVPAANVIEVVHE